MTTAEMKREIRSSKRRSKVNKSDVITTFYNDPVFNEVVVFRAEFSCESEAVRYANFISDYYKETGIPNLIYLNGRFMYHYEANKLNIGEK